MGNPISVLYGESEEKSGAVALELEEQPQHLVQKAQSAPPPQQDDEVMTDVESPRASADVDTPADRAAALVAQLTVDDAEEPDTAQLADLAAMLATKPDDDLTVDDTVRASRTAPEVSGSGRRRHRGCLNSMRACRRFAAC